MFCVRNNKDLSLTDKILLKTFCEFPFNKDFLQEGPKSLD